MFFYKNNKAPKKKSKQKPESQTGCNYPQLKSSQPQSSQSIFMELIKYSRKISPFTREMLKIVSIFSIIFIGLGFLDLLVYIEKQEIALPLSFLSSGNLMVLIILPILLALIALIIPYFTSITIYLALEDNSFNGLGNYLRIIYIGFIEFALLFLFYFLYQAGKGNIPYLYVFIIYAVILAIVSFILLFKGNWFKSINKFNWISFLSFFSLIIIFILFRFSFQTGSNYLLIIISAIYFLSIILPFHFYFYKYFNEDLAKNKNYYFLLTMIFVIIISASLIWVTIANSPYTFRMLKIGGNIPIKLLISQKYFNEIIDKNKILKSKGSTKKVDLSGHNIICCPKKANLKWHNFELLLKTPDNYYVKYGKNKQVFSIPVKYIHSKQILLQLHNNNISKSNKENKKQTNIINYAKSDRKSMVTMTTQNLTPWFLEPAAAPLIAAIIASIIGGLVTGLFMMWQNKRNFKYNLTLIELEDRKIEKAVLQALETEIKVIWKRYENFIKPSIKELLESDYSEKFTDMNKYMEDLNYFYILLSYRISISQDYFTIYNGNSSFIGKIKNEKLRKEIVSVYTNIKGFIELSTLVNKNQDKIEKVLKKDLEFASKFNNSQASTEVIISAYKTRLNNIIESIKQIKKQQDDLDIQIKNLLQSLDKEIKI
ncbi:MAG: ABC transporter permease [bacterium]